MPTYHFSRVTRHVVKTVPCRGCGRTLRRSATLGQSVNPFNKNADGSVKTREQICAELDDEADLWHPRNDICPRCNFDARATAHRA